MLWLSGIAMGKFDVIFLLLSHQLVYNFIFVSVRYNAVDLRDREEQSYVTKTRSWRWTTHYAYSLIDKAIGCARTAMLLALEARQMETGQVGFKFVF